MMMFRCLSRSKTSRICQADKLSEYSRKKTHDYMPLTYHMHWFILKQNHPVPFRTAIKFLFFFTNKTKKKESTQIYIIHLSFAVYED